MRTRSLSRPCFAAAGAPALLAVCLLAVPASAEEAVVSLSDSGGAGVVTMSDQGLAASTGAVGFNPRALGSPMMTTGMVSMAGAFCPTGDCAPSACGGAACNTCNTCNTCNPCNSGNCRPATGQTCQPCNTCNNCNGAGRQRRVRLFARADRCNNCNQCNNGKGGRAQRWMLAQQQNFFYRNKRLSQCLFGWMVPTGFCGQGAPPIGKYGINYAVNPGYAHPSDSMAYGAQGYGVPVSVPLAPNVRQSYNYSSGIPSSRITPVGSYVPGNGTAPLPRQTW